MTDLESEPLTGKQEKKEPRIFADPQAISSFEAKKINNESDIIFYQHLMRGPSEIHKNSFPADSRPNWKKKKEETSQTTEKGKRENLIVWGITGSASITHIYDMLMAIHLHVIPIST